MITLWLQTFKLIKRNVVPCQEISMLKRISHGSELSQLSEGVLDSKMIIPPWKFFAKSELRVNVSVEFLPFNESPCRVPAV